MNLPILYSFRRCPYAMRARIALYYSKQVCELREVVLKNKPPEMLMISEKGTVPVLVLVGDDAGVETMRVIDESLDVMSWALEQHDPDLWARDITHIGNAAKHPLIQRNDQYFTYWLNCYKYADRYPEAMPLDYFEKCCVFLQELEECMVQDKSELYFVMSPRLSFLDVAIFPFVRQCLAVDDGMTRAAALPKLKAWHEHLIESELFKKSMKKYPMWTVQQAEIAKFGVSG